MQTILGSGGAIGIALAKELTHYTDKIRLVSRKPVKVNATDELWAADLSQPGAARTAMNGSEIVYVTIGFPYSYKVWKEKWPPFMDEVIEACIALDCKLVFFDNIYMYDPEYLANMTEKTPHGPVSKKGEIRTAIAEKILQLAKKGKLKALIARSADFYGPSIQNTSMLTETVFKPLSQGKKANWMGDVNRPHAFTYTLDAAKATALLGNTPTAYQQVWHLPTDATQLTGKDWITHIAKELDVEPKYQVVSKWMLHALGLFIPFMREMPEMLYQYTSSYGFNSSKFEKHFNVKPTSYEAGIREIVLTDYKR